MFDLLPPFLFFFAAVVVPFLPQGIIRGGVMLIVPIIAAWNVWSLGFGQFNALPFFGFELELMRVDPLSRIFVLVFCLAAFLGNLYAWHVRDTIQQFAALLYAGSAIGAALAGDLITLFSTGKVRRLPRSF